MAQLNDGLVALPDETRTREAMQWVAEEIVDAGGTATTWVAQPGIAMMGLDLAAELAKARAAEYRAVAAEALAAAQLGGLARRAAKKRLLAELHRIDRRDYFPPAERREAYEAVNAIADP